MRADPEKSRQAAVRSLICLDWAPSSAPSPSRVVLPALGAQSASRLVHQNFSPHCQQLYHLSISFILFYVGHWGSGSSKPLAGSPGPQTYCYLPHVSPLHWSPTSSLLWAPGPSLEKGSCNIAEVKIQPAVAILLPSPWKVSMHPSPWAQLTVFETFLSNCILPRWPM